MDSKFAGENRLRQSGLSYTIVRPGGLSKEPAGLANLTAGVVGSFNLHVRQQFGLRDAAC